MQSAVVEHTGESCALCIADYTMMFYVTSCQVHFSALLLMIMHSSVMTVLRTRRPKKFLDVHSLRQNS
jgi:hypothetical protein